MEDEDYVPKEAKEFYSSYCSSQALSPEIVEVEEEQSRSSTTSPSPGRTSGVIIVSNVYIAVGKDDTETVKWALDNAVLPSTRVFLVYVYPPVTHIPTPVGKLARSQLSEDQVKLHMKEEGNKRKYILQKYMTLCNDAKVTVDTVLLENNDREKAILDLIPLLSITHLVIGTKRPPSSRRMKKKLSLGEFIRKNAPDFCEVSIVHEGKKVDVNQLVNNSTMPGSSRHSERSFFACFPEALQMNFSHWPHFVIDSAREGQNFLSRNRIFGDRMKQTQQCIIENGRTIHSRL